MTSYYGPNLQKYTSFQVNIQGCIKFLITPLGRGSLSSLLGKNIKLCRGEGNIMDVGKNRFLEKRIRLCNIICSTILRLLGRISSLEKGKVIEISGKKIKM